jgi:xanthine dehydrogenase YagT iron-sulfur-binding subunit
MNEITLHVNGVLHRLTVDPRTSLLDLLRERLGLTGSKKGCDHGQCGACTVLIDGRRANACLALAVAHDGGAVTTVEGLAANGETHPLQDAFIRQTERAMDMLLSSPRPIIRRPVLTDGGQCRRAATPR